MNAVDEQEASGSRRPLKVLAIAGGAVAAAYLGLVAWSAGGVPGGTSVSGVDIGGQSVEQATSTLETELADDAAEPLVLQVGEQTFDLDPATAGLALDAAATAEEAAGPVWSPVRLLQHVVGGVNVDPVVTSSAEELDAVLEGFAADADQPAVEPAIEMSTSPTLTPGEQGEGIDRPASADLIVASFLVSDEPVELPLTALDPTISDEEAQRVLAEYAEPAVAAAVRVSTQRSRAALEPGVIAEALSFQAKGETLEPQLNIEVVRDALPELTEDERPGSNATFDVSSGTPQVVPSKPGRTIDNDALTASLLAVLPETARAERVVAVELSNTRPDFTTRDARALNITERLSTFTQRFPYAEYRRVNVGQSAQYLNGTILKPGDTFSMNGTIKERTIANGYTTGTFIGGGGRFQEGLGGGVSISTTATWTAAFFAGLEAIEVNPHSLYISRYQAGLEATVAWDYLDLKFRNDTGNGVLITSSAGNDFITVTMWGTKVYDEIRDESGPRFNVRQPTTIYDTSAECTPQGGVEGFSINVDRVFIRGGQEVRRETFLTNYDPTNNVVCGPAPAPASSDSGNGGNGGGGNGGGGGGGGGG